MIPTETVYGLATLWRNPAGWERIYALKQRPAEKRLQMLAASLEQAAAAGIQISDPLRKIAAVFWPGPLTVVAAAAGNAGSIGLRIPAYPFLLQLLQKLGEPLAATSANRSGQPPAATAAEALSELDGEPELVVDGGRVSITGGVASTVISLLNDRLEILRPGPIPAAALQDCLNH